MSWGGFPKVGSGSLDPEFFQKRDQLIDPEVGQDFAVPVESGGLRLAAEIDHFLHGGAVVRDDPGFDFEVFAIEVIDHFDAPGAAGFDVKNGKAHGKWRVGC